VYVGGRTWHAVLVQRGGSDTKDGLSAASFRGFIPRYIISSRNLLQFVTNIKTKAGLNVVARLLKSLSGMEKHHDFARWASTEGIHINCIAPYRFEGRGLGIIAEKQLQVRRHALLDKFIALFDFPQCSGHADQKHRLENWSCPYHLLL
jgi:hypothetical protein